MTKSIRLLFAVLALAVLAAACGSAAANEPTTTPPTTAAPATTVAPTTTVTAAPTPPPTTTPAVDEACMVYMAAQDALLDRFGDALNGIVVSIETEDVADLRRRMAEVGDIVGEFDTLEPPESHEFVHYLLTEAFDSYLQGMVATVVGIEQVDADLLNLGTEYTNTATAGFQGATAALPEGC